MSRIHFEHLEDGSVETGGIPVISDVIVTNENTNESRKIRAILDTGAPLTEMPMAIIKSMRLRRKTGSIWYTENGEYIMKTAYHASLSVCEIPSRIKLVIPSKDGQFRIGRDHLKNTSLMLSWVSPDTSRLQGAA